MQLLQAAFYCLFFLLTALFVNVYGRCPAIDGALPKVPNGYRSNVDNVQLYSDGTAAGYYDISCEPGYALNTAIGGRITCLASGSWSQPLPQCSSMGRCSIPTLFEFLQNADGIRIDQSRSFIYTDGVNDNQALGGSNITVQCATGYINVGGSLTIVCTQDNNWTTLPNCTYNSSATTTTTAAPPLRCPVTKDTWIFTNGHISNTKGITVYDDNTAKGFVIVSCSPGYVMDSVSGGVYKCNNRTWSPKPYCTKTARCSLSILKDFVNNYTATMGLQISSQHLSINSEEPDEILIGSYILFNCKNGYKNTDNNLNVTCNANGQWSTFPSCTSLSTTKASSTSTTTMGSTSANNAVSMPAMNGGKRKKRWI